MAPIVASLAQWGLGLLANVVMKKGTEYVSEKTGVDLTKDTLSEEDRVKLLQFQMENETELQRITLEGRKIEYQAEEIMGEQLTRRHESDMNSDSWLSKNIRPITLIAVTLGLLAATFLPADLVAADKYAALCDLNQWVYGYYFLGRTTEKTGGVAGLRSAVMGGN